MSGTTRWQRLAAGLVLLAVALLLGASPGRASSTAPGSTVPGPVPAIDPSTLATLQQQAHLQGTVRVLVTLRVPLAGTPRAIPVGVLSAAQPSIRQARMALIASLQGSAARINAGTDWAFPGLALSVDAAGLARLAASPLIAAVEPDRVYHPADLDTTNGIDLIGAPAAWNLGYTGQGQAIAVIDTGVQADHPVLAGRVVDEACFSGGGVAADSFCPNGQTSDTGPGAAQPCPSYCEHGTHVAGIAAAYGLFNGGPGFNGVAPGADLIAVQISSNAGCDPTYGCGIALYESDILSGLNWVYQQRAAYHIAAVNLSLGNSSDYGTACDARDPLDEQAFAMLRGAGIAPVVAAGNDGYTDGISEPACVSSAISVGAVDATGAVASFSNRGPNLTFWAPGVNVYSSFPGSTYGTLSGTSMAAPMVAGALAVLRSADPTASVDQLVAALQSTGLPIDDAASNTTKPLIQIDKAVQYLLAGVTSLSVTAAGGTYGGTTVLMATLRDATNTPLSGQPITFTLNGTTVGQANTDASGVATLSAVSLGSLGAGTYPSAVGAAFAGSTTYQQSSALADLVVGPAALTITASSPSMTYGGTVPAIAPSYAGFVNEDTPASLTSSPVCSTTATSSTPVGSYPASCSGAVDANYTISYDPGTVTVDPAPLTVTAGSPTSTYGAPLPAVTASFSGLVSSDSSSEQSKVSCQSSPPAPEAVGSYPTSCTLADPNYTPTYVPGTRQITPAALTITAGSSTMSYGGPVPAITPSYAGFVNGDTAASLTIAPSCSAAAVQTSPVGSYPTGCSGAVDANYTISYQTGSLQVTPAALLVTASSPSIPLGAPLPAITPSYQGFVNGDTPASLTTAPTCGTTAGSGSGVGSYPTTCTGAVDANYAISYMAGTLTITPSPLLQQLVVLDGSATACTFLIQAGTVTASAIAVDGTNPTAAACLNAGTLSASSIRVVGGLRNHAGTIHGNLATQAAPTADPFAALPAPTAPAAACPGSACPQGPAMNGHGSFTLSPGTYTRPVTLNGNVTACLMPGIYVLEAGWTVNGSSRLTDCSGSPTGVVLYFQSGSLTLNGASGATLSAPSSGDYAGLAYWQAGGSAMTLNGSSRVTLNGAWYAPAGRLRLNGAARLTAAAMVTGDLLVNGWASVAIQ